MSDSMPPGNEPPPWAPPPSTPPTRFAPPAHETDPEPAEPSTTPVGDETRLAAPASSFAVPAPAVTPGVGGPDGHFGSSTAPDQLRVRGRHEVVDEAGPVFAGFWRRSWARFITAFLTWLVAGIGVGLLMALTGYINSNSRTCQQNSFNRQFCRDNNVVLVGGSVAILLYVAIVVYVLWDRRLLTRRGTAGMTQMGLSVRDAASGHPPNASQSLRRSALVMFLLWWPSVLLALVVLDPGRVYVVVWILVAILLALVQLVGGLVMLFNERRRTAWDALSDTVVVVDLEPSWFSVTALFLGVLVPVTATVASLAVAVGGLRREYERIQEGTFDTSKLVTVAIPVGIVAVLAVVFAHLGIRETRWEVKRRAGRGLAITAAVLGYAPFVVTGLGLLFSFGIHRVDSINTENCKEQRRHIAGALESYKTLNLQYPEDLKPLADGVYLGEAVQDNWVYHSAGQAYTLKGKNKCKAA